MNVQLQSRVPHKHKTTARIVFFEAAKEDSSYFERHFGGMASFHSNPLDPDHVEQAQEAEIVAISLGSRKKYKKMRNLDGLKLIVSRSSSLDHIDLRTCKQKRITVCNVPTYGSRAVAEFTLGLILMLT